MIAIRKIGGWKPFGTPQRPQNHGKTATDEADQDTDHDDDDNENIDNDVDHDDADIADGDDLDSRIMAKLQPIRKRSSH